MLSGSALFMLVNESSIKDQNKVNKAQISVEAKCSGSHLVLIYSFGFLYLILSECQ